MFNQSISLMVFSLNHGFNRFLLVSLHININANQKTNLVHVFFSLFFFSSNNRLNKVLITILMLRPALNLHEVKRVVYGDTRMLLLIVSSCRYSVLADYVVSMILACFFRWYVYCVLAQKFQILLHPDLFCSLKLHQCGVKIILDFKDILKTFFFH